MEYPLPLILAEDDLCLKIDELHGEKVVQTDVRIPKKCRVRFNFA